MPESGRSKRVEGLAWTAGAHLAALAVAVPVALAVGLERPLASVLVADVAATVVVFAFSFHKDNSSLYDPYWSVAPLVIAPVWLFVSPGMAPGAELERLRDSLLDAAEALGVGTSDGGAGDARRWIALVVVAVWGVRLTYNQVRRWRGVGDEDFRYVDLRRKTGRAYWLVSLLGIHLFPTLLVWAGCLPLVVIGASGRPLGPIDFLGVAVAGVAIGIEARADRELADFKRSNPAPGALLTTGSWARVRHPNYLGEVLFWWGLFIVGIGADPGAWWTGFGALAITLLFRFVSIPMKDARMLARRPRYAEVIASTPALLPGRGKARGDR